MTDKQQQPNTPHTRSIADSVMQSIESHAVQMKPKWQFAARESVLWIVAITAIVIGALAFSVIVYSVANTDYDLYMHSTVGPLSAIMRILPYFWIVLLILFVATIEWNIKQTKKGYRYKTSVILAISVLCSIVAGVILHALHIGKAIDYALEERLPYYAGYLSPRHSAWLDPEHGLLAGRVLAVEDDFILLETVRGQEWKVVFIDIDKKPAAYLQIQTDRHIRVIGEQLDEQLFQAYDWKLRPADEPFGLGGKRPQKARMLAPAQ